MTSVYARNTSTLSDKKSKTVTTLSSKQEMVYLY